ncbi:hypothetical protein, partial [Hansschlegelia zhihuaiae]|uniref:hypothetical protein n=1 Tax=Hansschlegelia zhihuaiae TaxID=405005 RepID=UPI0013E8D38A
PPAAAAAFAPGGGRRVVAAEVEGPFDSAFETPPGGAAAVHLGRGTRASAVFGIADVDWILDPFAYEPQTEPGAPRRPRSENVALFLNMVERAAGGGGLIAIRSRGGTRRTLTRVADLARDMADVDRASQAAAMTRIAEIEARIAQLPATAGVSDLSQLPAEVQGRVAELRSALAPDRKILREAERRERAGLERLRTCTVLFNLLGGPALALAMAGLIAAARRRGARSL